MLKSEGPAQLYERARADFLKSLVDGVDRENAAAEYYFSLVNLQNRGVVYPWGSNDHILQKMSSILLKQPDDFEGDIEAAPADPRAYQFHEGTQLVPGGGVAGIRDVESNMAADSPFFGRFRSFDTPRVLRATPGEEFPYELDDQSGPNFGMMHTVWPDYHPPHPDDTHHYPDDHPWQAQYHPLLSGMEMQSDEHPNGQPAFVDTLRAYYIRPDADTPSLAERHATVEREWEKANRHNAALQPFGKTTVAQYHKARSKEAAEGGDEDAAAFYNNFFGLGEDEQVRERTAHFPFLGPLSGSHIAEGPHGSHQYEIYNKNFRDWLSENDYGEPGSADEEWQMRQQHFDEMAESWLGGDVQTDAGGDNHGERLGWLGYNLGLEFLKPHERSAALEHLYYGGSDYDQNVNLGDGFSIPMSRLKRNFVSRVAPEYLWWYRQPNHHGPNAHTYPEEPFKTADISLEGLHDATLQENVDGTPVKDILLAGLNHGLQIEQFDEKGEDNPDWHGHYPQIDRQTGEIKRRTLHKKWRGWLPMSDLHTLAGYDPETGEAYESGQHPFYGAMFDEPLIDKDTLDRVIERGRDNTGIVTEEKRIRNAYHPYMVAFGPHPDHQEQHGLGEWWLPHSELGHTAGFASHFHEPFKTGGVARSPMTWWQALHDTFATHVELDSTGRHGVSHSLFGSMPMFGAGAEFEEPMNLRSDMTGLLGPFHPFVRRGALTEKRMEVEGPEGRPSLVHAGWEWTGEKLNQPNYGFVGNLSGLLNLWEGSHSPMDPSDSLEPKKRGVTGKNNLDWTTSTFHSPFFEERRRFTDKEFAEQHTTGKHNIHLGGGGEHITMPYLVEAQTGLAGRTTSPHSRSSSILSSRLSTLLGRLAEPGQPHEGEMPRDMNEVRQFIESNPGQTSTGDARNWLLHQGSLEERAEPAEMHNILHRDLNALRNSFPEAVPAQLAEMLQNPPVEELKQRMEPKALQDFLERSPQYAQMENLPETVRDTASSFPEGPVGEQEHQMATYANRLAENAGQLMDLQEQALHAGDRESYQRLGEELSHLRPVLAQLEEELQKIPTREAGPAGGAAHPLREALTNEHLQMTKTHMDAITNVAAQMRDEIEQQHPGAFSGDDPLRYLSNVLQTFRMANQKLLRVPHQHHGQHGHGLEIDDVPEKSVSEAAGSDLLGQLGQGILSSEMGKRKAHGAMSEEELHEMMGTDPTNDIHQKNIQSLMGSLGEALMEGSKDLVPMRLSELVGAGLIPGQGINPIAGDLMEMAEEHRADRQHPIHRNARHLKRILSLTPEYEQQARERGFTLLPSAEHEVRHRGPAPKAKKKGGASRAPQHGKESRELLDSMLLMDPAKLGISGEQKMGKKVQWGMRPLSPAIPGQHSIQDLLESDRADWGWEMMPDFLTRFGADGATHVVRGRPTTTRLHSVPLPYLLRAFPEAADIIGSDLHFSGPNQITPNAHGEVRAADPLNRVKSEDGLSFLTNPDLLLKADDEWSPPIRPMHRIFSESDLDALKGFSGDWVVSRISQGERLLVKQKDDKVTVFDENGKERKGLEKGLLKALGEVADDDFVIDGMLNDGQFQVLDLLKYDDDDVSDLQTRERVKLLRANFSSNEQVEMPAPHNTRTTDEEGLQKALEGVKSEEPSGYLLRDADSTYMKGERRHPKWILLRAPKEVNLIVLDRKGEGPYSYRLGAGPLLDSENLGNRAAIHSGQDYMDVGTVVRSDKPFNIGDIVNVGVDSVHHSTRKGRDVFTVQTKDMIGEGFGEGPASMETLSLLTKSHPPMLWPHDISFDGERIIVSLPTVGDEVLYKADSWPQGWQIHSPHSLMGELGNTDYPIRLSESLRPFWAPVAAALLRSDTFREMKNGTKKEAVIEDEGEEAEPLIPPKKVKDTFHKPTMKALLVAARALDLLYKERQTWTGARGMGMGPFTPDVSPRGPTSLNHGGTVPDWDMRKRPTEDMEQPTKDKPKGKPERKDELKTERGERGRLEVDGGDATLTI